MSEVHKVARLRVVIYDAQGRMPAQPLHHGVQRIIFLAQTAMLEQAQLTNEPVAKLVEVGHDGAVHQLSIATWVAIGAGLFGLAMTLLLLKRSAGRMDLGSVSEQWMAQHRAGRIDDPQH